MYFEFDDKVLVYPTDYSFKPPVRLTAPVFR